MKTNRYIISASVVGRGHLDSGVPCQDANNWKMLNDFWGIAVISDGAGSYENSHKGSAFVVKNIIEVVRDAMTLTKWYNDNVLPSDEAWRDMIIIVLKQTRDNLQQYAKESDNDFHSTGCTLNLVVFSKEGLLTAHIGDGRACYQNENKEWKAMLKPFKGNEVGSTVFITTNWIWENTEKYIETRVICENIKSFVLLTDGMETASFLCYTKNENEHYFDPNQPFEKFFNTNISAINAMINQGIVLDEINERWSTYLSSSQNLAEENDDKTMLIGIFKD